MEGLQKWLTTSLKEKTKEHANWAMNQRRETSQQLECKEQSKERGLLVAS